jgi:outer membrane lipoprotein-sorting protein
MGIRLGIFLTIFGTALAAAEGFDPQAVVRNMAIACEKLEDYRMEVEIGERAGDGSWKQKRFTYTFKKPNHVRVDFHEPDRGTVVIYPDRNGKVLVLPFGWRALAFHLGPDNMLLSNFSGQRIDQTDLGLLVRNITWSLNGGRRGPAEVSETRDDVRIRVLAEDHFRKGTVTRYEFLIDKKSWLPVEVEESTPEGALKRKIVFKDLKANLAIPDSLFSLNGK